MKSTKNIIDEAADGLSDYAIFAFFYINRKKYWFSKKFRLLVYDKFTRYELS